MSSSSLYTVSQRGINQVLRLNLWGVGIVLSVLVVLMGIIGWISRIPLWLGASIFAGVFGLTALGTWIIGFFVWRRTKRVLNAYQYQLNGDVLTCRQLAQPEISIARAEVKELQELFGGFVVLTGDRQRQISVMQYVDGYAELKQQLYAWAPHVPVTRRLIRVLVPIAIYFCGLLMLLSHQIWLTVLGAVLMIGATIYQIRYARSVKQRDDPKLTGYQKVMQYVGLICMGIFILVRLVILLLPRR